jgi:hypothetical protein
MSLFIIWNIYVRDEERHGTREDAHEFGEYQAKK